MNKVIICFSFFLLINCNIVKKNSNQNELYHKITKIDSINSYYLVYTTKGDSVFQIVSKKEVVESCKKIEIGKDYMLKLTSFRSTAPYIGNIKISPVNDLHIKCFQFEDNTEICKEEGISDLYFTKNLKGLCIK
ncbi:hypothetical protein AB4865_06790 [Capnocytophaga sp. ARDL2]|uniref:hypothetical protein n=1 Tax=Capnocytophaga sp. ARDL2 TaxID=3238809 RepID=UPI003556B057